MIVYEIDKLSGRYYEHSVEHYLALGLDENDALEILLCMGRMCEVLASKGILTADDLQNIRGTTWNDTSFQRPDDWPL